MVGTSKRSSCSKYGANFSARGPSPKNSTQPDESTRKSSEPFFMVTVAFFPLEVARQPAKVNRCVQGLDADLPVDLEDHQLLPRAELEPLAQFLRHDNLEFR